MMTTLTSRGLTIALGLSLMGIALSATTASANSGAGQVRADCSSQEIAEVQAILERAGYLAPDEYATGENDELTQAALRSFQAHHRLPPTGRVDHETMAQLSSHAGTNDRDGDRVVDDLDWCPNTRPETQVDAHGCQLVARRDSLFDGRRSVNLEGVTFDTGTAHLTPDARVVLDRVAGSLISSPDTRVEVNGYTDSRNTSASNLALSRARSAAVCEYLVDQGVASSRLQEHGFGESNPIADNTTAAGRATNRRVVFIRID
ncbi:MAG TPA: OmpA family protein [Candidatus Polarisedimenticolia bacterium]|jgi:outer membrane protein OmpA-like peptidoglycan-associated protein|nr:OmpA family protein [Candidatus Polarisedimenticolia bacterium]